MAGTYEIPFLNGKPLSYVDSWTASSAKRHGGVFEWRARETVKDALQFVRLSRGRSSVKAVFMSEHYGCEVELFCTDFDDKVHEMVRGKLSGLFKFRKRGKNYGYEPQPTVK
jgi:hypothetical protein